MVRARNNYVKEDSIMVACSIWYAGSAVTMVSNNMVPHPNKKGAAVTMHQGHTMLVLLDQRSHMYRIYKTR